MSGCKETKLAPAAPGNVPLHLSLADTSSVPADDACSVISTDSRSDGVHFPDNPESQGISLPAVITGVSCKAFVDSGATGRLGNFIDAQFASKLGLKPTGGSLVEGFGHFSASSSGTVRVRISLLSSSPSSPPFRQTMSFTVVDLARHDVVLGYPFLQQHNPLADWQAQTLSFQHNGRGYKLQGCPISDVPAPSRVMLMESSNFASLCASSEVDHTFLLLVNTAKPAPVVGKEVSDSHLPADLHPAVAKLVLKYPQAFPPVTIGKPAATHGHQHTIKLVDENAPAPQPVLLPPGPC